LSIKRFSDDLVESAHWKTEADKQRTVDEIILHHGYLHAAYTSLRKVSLQGKYYANIRAMVQRDRNYEEIEGALFALANYKKKEDIRLIKETLSWLNPSMSAISFRLMRDYPDTAYMEVLRYYFDKRRFYRNLSRSEYYAWDAGPEFLRTVASYRSDSSARILKAILNRKPFCSCTADTNSLKETLLRAIWANPCPAYVEVRRQIQPEMAAILKRDSTDTLPLDSDSGFIFKDITDEPVHW